MKRFLSVLLSLTMLLTCVPLGAVSVSAATMENGLVYEIANGEVTITGYTDDLPAELVIPDTIGGYPVTAIACEAFQGCPFLTSVVISRSVTGIDDYAFRGCTALSEIIFLNSTTLIGEAAFYDTAYYNDPANWDQDVLYIDNHLIEAKRSLTGSYAIKEGTLTIAVCAFMYCSSLTSVSIPDSVTHIQVLAFSDCSALTSLTIPKSVTFIGNLAFQRTALTDVYYAGTEEDFASIDIIIGNDPLLSATWHYNSGVYNGMTYTIEDGEVTITGHTDDLPAELVIPDTIGGYPVTAIGDAAFVLCDFLTTVTMPDSLKYVRNGAFIGCASLTSIIIPDSVTIIEAEAFMNCTALTSVVLPNSITGISNWVFMGCSSLVSIAIPDGVTRIGDLAFIDCISLASVTIPKSVTSIDQVAFYNCPFLTDVYYSGTEEDRANIRVDVNNDSLLSATWHYNYVEPAKLFSPVVTHSVMDTERGAGLAFKFELWASVGIKGTNIVDFTNATINYMGETCKLVGMGAVMSNRADATLDLDNVNGITTIDIPAVYLTDWEPDSCAFATRIVNIPNEYIEYAIYARPYYIVEVDGEAVAVYGDIDFASCLSAIG